MKNKFTVIIWTSCNRIEIFNICKYFLEQEFTIIIIATDSRVFELVRGLKIDEIYVKDSISDRLEYAASKVTTPYAMLHTDDDLVPVKFIYKAIKWLENNPSYSSVSGTLAIFSDNWINSYLIYAKKLDNLGPSNLSEHFKNYQFSYIYAVHKSRNLIHVLKSVAKAYEQSAGDKIHPAVSIELAIEMCFSYISNLKLFKSVYLLKQIYNELEQPAVMRIDSNIWLQKHSNLKKVVPWVNSLSLELKNNAAIGEDTQKISSNFLKAFDLFVESEQKKYNNKSRSLKIMFRIFSIEVFSHIKKRLLNKAFYLYLISSLILIKLKIVKRKIYIPGYSAKSLKNINKVFENVI